MITSESIQKRFEQRFSCNAKWISSAPGRVNLIGEHTDYNGGFVLPAAIDRGIKIAARLRRDDFLNLYSETFNESVSFSVSTRIPPPKTKGWYSYFAAVADQFMKKDKSVPGMDVYICGDIPLGAGLSSSAAFEVCVATLLDAVLCTNLSKQEIAVLSREAEHSEYVGVQCGIMDQFIAAMGKKDHALQIDCYSLDYKIVPFDSEKAAIVLCNSMKKRGLVDSAYNQRRSECNQGLKIINELGDKTYPTLRHVPYPVFEKYKARLPENVQKRVLHNLTENRRVLEFVEALEANDFAEAGALLFESHESLEEDYEVSCKELDRIVEISAACKGVFGSRMTGAGFGGCAVSLVKPNHVEEFKNSLSETYNREFNVLPEIYVASPQNGAEISHIE